MGLRGAPLGARFWSLIGATFLGFLGIGAVLPALAPHIRFQLGGSDQTVGLVIGIFSFVALAARVISGPLADHKGRRIALLAGLLSCAASGASYLLPLGISGAFLGRILQGFGEACLYTGAAAWVIEIAGVDRSAESLGYLSAGIWGGISVGPVVGEWLGTFERAAVLQLAAALLAAALLVRIPEAYKPAPRPGRQQWIPRPVVLPGIAIGFVNVHYPVIAGFLILHLSRFHKAGPLAFSAYALMILTSRFFLGSLPDRINPAITFYGGIAAMAVGLVVLARGPGAWLAVAATALLGFGFSFPWSSVAGTVLRQIPNHERGSAVGVLGAFVDLFVGLSSFSAGAVAHRFGYEAIFYGAAASLVVAAVIGHWMFRWPGSMPFPPMAEEQPDTEAAMEVLCEK
ncbi:MAG: MFS transporter [Bryobacterales bacterium]|nr:MFS transporter [Bryobacterales bacterium]